MENKGKIKNYRRKLHEEFKCNDNERKYNLG